MKPHLAAPEQYNITHYEDVYVAASGGVTLHGWWFAARSNSEEPASTLIFLHGNGENISTHAGLVHWLTQYNFNVFIFDYRGYGKSTGKADVKGALSDVKNALEYVRSRNGNRKLFLMGHSLGASLGIVSLASEPLKTMVDGMIFVAPFSEYRQVARDMMSKSWLTWAFQWPASMTISNEYDPVTFVDALPEVPKVFIYSEDDMVIDKSHVVELFEKAEQPKSLEVFNGRHNTLFAHSDNQQIILKYLYEWDLQENNQAK